MHGFCFIKKHNSYLAGGRWWQSCSDRPGAAVVIHPMTGATAALHLWNSATNTLSPSHHTTLLFNVDAVSNKLTPLSDMHMQH